MGKSETIPTNRANSAVFLVVVVVAVIQIIAGRRKKNHLCNESYIYPKSVLRVLCNHERYRGYWPYGSKRSRKLWLSGYLAVLVGHFVLSTPVAG